MHHLLLFISIVYPASSRVPNVLCNVPLCFCLWFISMACGRTLIFIIREIKKQTYQILVFCFLHIMLDGVWHNQEPNVSKTVGGASWLAPAGQQLANHSYEFTSSSPLVLPSVACFHIKRRCLKLQEIKRLLVLHWTIWELLSHLRLSTQTASLLYGNL